MEIKRVCALYFSATGNTEKTVAAFAETLAEQLGVPWERLPFTKPAEREQDYVFADTDLVVVGTPTYAGKLPNKILPDLKARLHSNGALAAAIVTFGNRSYDNALAELCAVLEGDGFYTVAGGAFVGRHAFTDKLAEDRPDWDDRKELKKFATAIADKVKNLTENPAPVTVPGDPEAPYYIPKGTDGEPAKFLKAKPRTDPAKCTNCGACREACPRKLIVEVPYSKKVFVNCSNKDKGPAVTKVCANSCIGCGMCQRTCKFDAIHVVNNVAVIDYTKCKGCTMCAKACPRNAIEPIPTPEEKEKFKAAQKAAAEKKAAAAKAAAEKAAAEKAAAPQAE